MNTTYSHSSDSDGSTLRDLLHGNEAIFPTQLSTSYPHILKKICALWEEPVIACRYFDELLTTRREKRQGFPYQIHREIFILSYYYTTRHPAGLQYDDFWNAIYSR